MMLGLADYRQQLVGDIGLRIVGMGGPATGKGLNCLALLALGLRAV